MEDVIAIWKEADAVCFDVDSTVIQEEGIDELAIFCGKGPEVQAMWVYFLLKVSQRYSTYISNKYH